jgi:5-methylcytosine-specific restriction endonuclease McrA
LQEAAFHIDHISPRSGKGPSHADNLALACVTCSLKKAARTRVRDPQTKKVVPLFHPRHDRWSDHFRWTGSKLIGRTATGRATIFALGMNRPAIVAIRQTLIELGRFTQD